MIAANPPRCANRGATGLRRNASRPSRHGPRRHGPSAGSPTQRARDDGSNCQTAIEPRGGKQKQPRGRSYGAPGSAPGKRIAAVGAGPGGSGSTKRQHCRGCRAGPVSAIRGSTSTGHDLAGTGKRQHHARAAHRVRRPASRPDDRRPGDAAGRSPGFLLRLPRQRPAVAARVGAGEQHAGRGIAADDLDAARAFEIADRVDRVAAPRQLAPDLLRRSGAPWSARPAPSCG